MTEADRIHAAYHRAFEDGPCEKCVTPDRDEQEPSATRSQWQPVYMGEGIPDRCANCSQVKGRHSVERGTDLYCYESFARAAHGDR